MRVGPAIAAVGAAALIAAGAAQAAPPAEFELDWDTRDSAGGFSPDAALNCQAPPPGDPYSAPPCTARSPVYRRAGEANVAIRVTDPLDVTQGTAHQVVFIDAPGDPRRPPARKPGGGGATID